MFIYLIMLVYWGSFTVVLTQLFKNNIKQDNRIYVLLAGGTLILLMSLRDVSVGTDTLSYYYEYLNADTYLQLRISEQGYGYFNYFFSTIMGFDFQTYLFITSLVIIFTISKLYIKYSKNIMLSYYLFVTLGFFAMTLTGLRQSLAVIITVYAFMFLMNNKNIMFFISVFIAALFHNSAIVFLLVYFLKNIKLTKMQSFVLYIIAVSSFFLINIFIPIVERFSNQRYINRYISLETNVNSLVILIYILIPLAVIVISKPTNENKKLDSTISIMLMISFINIIVYFIATEVVLFDRISYYFMIYNTILIPNSISSIRNRDIKLIAKVACIILPLLMFLISTPGGSLGIDNYKFFWK